VGEFPGSEEGRPVAIPRWVATALVVLGLVLLVVAVFLPWYAFGASSAAGRDTQLFYPGLPSENGSIRYSCSGSISCPPDSSYSTQSYDSIGTVVETGLLVSVVAIVAAAITAVLGAMAKARFARSVTIYTAGIVAAVLALATPILYGVALPGAENRDVPDSARPPTSGPWTSFFGSASWNEPHLGTLSLTWGPESGWYLSIGAAALIVVGLVLFRKGRGSHSPNPESTQPSR
jgi:hypothetical protein